MADPVFSIITVTKNSVRDLQQTMISVQGQCSSNYEWVVIDGASNDGTVDLLKTSNALWISEPDRGIYDAMNKGIDRSHGDYMLFLNAGDRLASEKVLDDVDFAIQQHAAQPNIVYGDVLLEMNRQLLIKRSRVHSRIELGMFTHHQSIFYRRLTVADQRYALKYRIASDYEFTARFVDKIPGYSCYYYGNPISIFRKGGVSQKKIFLNLLEQHHIRKELKLCSPFDCARIFLRQHTGVMIRIIAPNVFAKLRNREGIDK